MISNEPKEHGRTVMSNGDCSSVLVEVTVELFGRARIISGRQTVEISVPHETDRHEVAAALAAACRELVGTAIQEGGADLLDSYTLNLNSTEFVNGRRFRVAQGDRLLLFSSQAGG